MMERIQRITKVERQKRSKHRYNIYLDEEYAFSVHEDIMIKHRLLKNEEVETSRLQEIMLDEERQSAYLKAIKQIGIRPRSMHEVRQKLGRDGFEEETVNDVIQRLVTEGYLNDLEFAKLFIEHRTLYQKKGRHYIRQELTQKGLSSKQIGRALEELDKESELEGAMALARKQWRTTSGEIPDKKRKTMAYLLRRGYPSSIVHQAVNRVMEEIQSETGE